MMKKKFLLALCTAVLLICTALLSACDPSGTNPNGTDPNGNGGGGGNTTLAKVTGFSYDNTGYWVFNAVTGAEEYTIMIASPEYYLTVKADKAENGKFKVDTGSIAVGKHTAYIVAKAAGKTDSEPASCTANVTQAGIEVPLTVQNARFDNAKKILSWDTAENAVGYTAALRLGWGYGLYSGEYFLSGSGNYLPIPVEQIKTAGNTMQAVINYDLLVQQIETLYPNSSGLMAMYLNKDFTPAGGGPLEFKITATGKTEGLTTYLDAEEHIFDETYAITKLATPAVQIAEYENWYTKKATFKKVANATGYEIIIDGKTLQELNGELIDEGENMAFYWSISPEAGANLPVSIKAISETDGIMNVMNITSEPISAAFTYSKPAAPKTYEDVKTALMPKIVAALKGNYPTFTNSASIVLKGFNLNDGKVYWEYENPINNQTYLASGDIRNWATLNPKKYEDIITHLNVSSNNIQNATNLSLEANAWESVLAELGDDYHDASDLAGWLAEQG
jgi:hypothetical protein